MMRPMTYPLLVSVILTADEGGRLQGRGSALGSIEILGADPLFEGRSTDKGAQSSERRECGKLGEHVAEKWTEIRRKGMWGMYKDKQETKRGVYEKKTGAIRSCI